VEQCTSCPSGHYCEGSGSTEPTGLCSAGYYCPQGESIPNAKGCPKRVYCPVGSAQPINFPAGENMLRIICLLVENFIE
jgi:hypothetical protein